MKTSFKILIMMTLITLIGCTPICMDCNDIRIDGVWSEVCFEVECDEYKQELILI